MHLNLSCWFLLVALTNEKTGLQSEKKAYGTDSGNKVHNQARKESEGDSKHPERDRYYSYTPTREYHPYARRFRDQARFLLGHGICPGSWL